MNVEQVREQNVLMRAYYYTTHAPLFLFPRWAMRVTAVEGRHAFMIEEPSRTIRLRDDGFADEFGIFPGETSPTLLGSFLFLRAAFECAEARQDVWRPRAVA